MSRFRSALIFLVAFSMSVFTCKKADDPFSAEMHKVVSSDVEFESVTNEVDDMVLSALVSADTPTGRAAAITDDRITCAALTYDSTANRVTGSVTIDFGVGCTDARGNLRIGKITVSWTGGRWYKVGSHQTISFTGYAVNGIAFSSTDVRTIHNISSVSSPLTWTVEGVHNLVYADLVGANRTIHLTRQWVRAANPVNDKLIISQTRGAASAASGTNRYSKAYTVVITTPIEYLRSCTFANKVMRPVKGTRTITYDSNKTSTVDFGTGACDANFTATNGITTKTFTFKNNGIDD